MGRTESNLNWMTPDCSHRRSKNSKQKGLSNQVAIDWRTPSAQESGVSVDRLEGELGKRMYDKETSRNAQYGLQQQVNWPTPNTPSGGAKADGSAPQGMNGGKGHREKMKGQFNPGAKLNPSWVEQLMGLPVGWTQLSGATDPNENRVDRLRLLGNGVVPATAEKAFRTLFEKFKND